MASQFVLVKGEYINLAHVIKVAVRPYNAPGRIADVTLAGSPLTSTQDEAEIEAILAAIHPPPNVFDPKTQGVRDTSAAWSDVE